MRLRPLRRRRSSGRFQHRARYHQRAYREYAGRHRSRSQAHRAGGLESARSRFDPTPARNPEADAAPGTTAWRSVSRESVAGAEGRKESNAEVSLNPHDGTYFAKLSL